MKPLYFNGKFLTAAPTGVHRVAEELIQATDRLLATQPDAPEERLQRMLAIVQTEKHRVAPGCATCAMPCGNTNDYDFVRLWAAPESIRTLKLQMLSAAFALAQKRPQGQAQAAVYQLLFTLAEDWDEELLAPVVQHAKELCRE